MGTMNVGQLLDQMLRYDAADLDMSGVVAMFKTLTVTLPPTVFTVLPARYSRDAERLARSGYITLPKGFPHEA